MKSKHIILLGLIALFTIPSIAYAGLTGVLAGKLIDANGNPIPGVTITVTSENLQGVRFDTTSANGMYRMPELPPGLYTVTAELEGMQTIERRDIRVSVNSTTKIDFTMEMSKFEETFIVVGEQPILDVKSATVKSTIERTVTERLPASDTLFAAFAMSGGITGAGNVRVHGGANTDNLYLFDGVDTTDPVTSTFGANLNADAIEEVEVMTGGFSAEYGRSMGGIVNAVTKSGGNEFHGIVRLKYNNSSWHDDYEHPQAEQDFSFWDPTVTLEGPILKDKLWFMVTYNYFDRPADGRTIGFYGADFDNPDDLAKINQDRVFHLPYAKLTFQPSQSHKIVVNYSGETATIHNTTGDPEYNTPESWNKQEQGGPFYSLEWTWLYNSNLFFVARAGTTFGILNNVPESGDSNSPHFFDTYEQVHYNGSETWNEEERDRTQLNFSATYFIEDLAGTHEFKSGLEWQTFKHDDYSITPGNASYTINNNPNDPDAWQDSTRVLYINPGSAVSTGDYMAFFLQDNWSIRDNLTLNLGARYEYTIYKNDDGDSSVPAWTWGQFRAESYRNPDGSFKNYADMKFDNMIAPRVGVNWDIFSDGKSVVHAFYGRFYNPFDLSLPSQMFQPFSANNTATKTQEYIGPEWHDSDRDGIPDEDYFFSDANWETYEQDSPDAWNLIDPDIEAEYTDEYMIGFEQELLDKFTVGVSYTHRETNNMIEDTGIFTDADGNIVWTYLGGVNDDFSGIDPSKDYDPLSGRNGIYDHHLYYVTNAKGSTREYHGIEISAKARLKNYDLQASYTYSKAEGSVTEAQAGYDGISQFSGQFDTWATSQNLFGELPWSAKHYLKIAGSAHYDITDWYELSLGVNGFLRSGYPYSKRMIPPRTFDPSDPTNDPNDRDTWTGRPPYNDRAWYFPDGRGSYDLPSVASWDVSLQNSLKFGKWGSLTVIFDVFNVFNAQTITSETDTYNPAHPENFGQANDWADPRTYTLSFKYSF
ncbi:TonB-dependent receptor [bacterium]|nr:TonB-dependent receptor [candidate division CSSED10-310 bacterium]